MKREHLQPAYILHRRSYRENSFLVELFTRDHGRMTAIAKGVRKAKASSQGLLQQFMPVLVSWAGKSEMVTLTHIETSAPVMRLHGECVYAGFYLNELLIHLLEKWTPHPELFNIYSATISALESGELKQKTLRVFEKFLLEDLGYGLLPKSDHSLHNSLLPDKFYRYVPEQGFVVSELGEEAKAKATIFSGRSLLSIMQENWDDEECLQDAKRLTRFMLAPLLGARTIHSRRLFIDLYPVEGEKNET